MTELRSVRELSRWATNPALEVFPYDAVVGDYHLVGKHFVAPELLDALVGIRSGLAGLSGSPGSRHLLARFLDTALDKRDGRYDYPTYLALSLLPLPGVDDPDTGDVVETQRQHDRLVVQLLADAMAFELAVLDGRTALFPELRPSAGMVAKRVRLGLRAMKPALDRLDLQRVAAAANQIAAAADQSAAAADQSAVARETCAVVDADTSTAERRILRLSILPAWVAHDEYMFIRVLQTFEAAFAILVVHLRAAVEVLVDGDIFEAADAIELADTALREVSRAFSLMATMQIESFLAFRQYTEGASAIQSRNYKLVESLCRLPEQQRLDSPAYLSVPDVRTHVLTGPANLDDALWTTFGASELPAGKCDELVAAMRRFESTLLQWRQIHYRLALRMLGDRVGTGYTEGTPYLRDTRTVPVFRSIDQI